MPKTVCIMYVILIIMLSAKIKLKSVYSGNCKYRFTKIQHEKEFRSQSTKTYSGSCWSLSEPARNRKRHRKRH